MTWDAVVLAGGRGRRLGGVDKPGLLLDGRSLLDRTLAAVAGARHRIVVGPERPATPGVRFVREEPRFGGPVAALAAGLAALPADSSVVVVLAADLPAVEAALPIVLAAALPVARGAADGCIGVDPAGRDQPLLAAYRVPALTAALATLAEERGLDGAALRALVQRLALVRVPLPADLCADVDEPADAVRAGIPLPPARTAGAPMTDSTDPTRSSRPATTSADQPSTGRPSDLDAWTAHLAAELGIDPAVVDIGAILDLARDAAHTVARPAAPLTAFLLGYAAARRGAGGVSEVREVAARATEVVSAWGA